MKIMPFVGATKSCDKYLTPLPFLSQTRHAVAASRVPFVRGARAIVSFALMTLSAWKRGVNWIRKPPSPLPSHPSPKKE